MKKKFVIYEFQTVEKMSFGKIMFDLLLKANLLFFFSDSPEGTIMSLLLNK